MASKNPNMALLAKGLTNPVDFTTPATNKDKVQALIDLISNEEMNQTELRLFTDKMDPNARAGIFVMLTALKAAIVNV